MARLFIGPKEQAFVNDISKEFQKDLVGQFIIYYPVSIIHTKVHSIYEEALEKMFENPIKLDVLAGQPDRKNTADGFGYRIDSTIEIYVQPRDLIDKGLEVFAGDFFTYGSEAYEVITAIAFENIYGQVEYDRGIKILGKLAKHGEFNLRDLKNNLEASKQFEESQVQKTFVQQRGTTENSEGSTNDHRQIRDRLGDDMADIALGEQPARVDLDEKDNEAESADSSGFYHE